MKTELSPEVLFCKYIGALKDKDNRIRKLEHKLRLRNWNLYFFAKEGMKNQHYDVWCNKLGKFPSVKNELKKYGKDNGKDERLETHEFLWDLCWAKRHECIDKEDEDFLALVLEQELNDWVTSKVGEEAWWDFTKILYAEVTTMRVFIGRSSKQGFKTFPEQYADYYRKVHCSDVGLLLMLINWTTRSKVLTIRGWELTKSGEAKPLGDERTFAYSGKV